MSDDNENVRVALAEIRGDVKLVLAGQDRANSDIRDIRGVIRTHDTRIGSLEAGRDHATGERKGLATGARILWATVGLIPGGAVVAVLMRLFQ